MVAKCVFFDIISHINAIKLFLSTMKMPRSLFVIINVVSPYVLLSALTTELEKV